MHAWEAIQKAVDYIEDTLPQKHTPEELAGIAALSLFYFQRLFTKLVKRPVSEYIKMRRLAKACEVLADKNARILDIALEYGFNSHESFTKNFKSAFGITPDEYRTNPVPLNQVVKPELLLNYTMIDENVPLITDSIVLEIMRKKLDNAETYIGLTGKIPISQQIPVGEATGIDAPYQLWDSFHKVKPDIPGLLLDGIELGASMPGDAENGNFTYFAGASAMSGVSVSAMPSASITGEYSVWELPAGEYVVCSFEAENFTELTTTALDKAMKYLFDTWLSNHKLITQPFSAEKYYETTPDSTRMEIWVMPIPANC